MAGPLLSQQEFERWCESDWHFKERVLDHIDTQYERNIATEGRVSALETATSKNAKVGWTSIVIAVISGIALVLSAVLGGSSAKTLSNRALNPAIITAVPSELPAK